VNWLLKYLSLTLLLACFDQNDNLPFQGFWEGPHPDDVSKKFYIHIENVNYALKAKGYWTQNNFYQESFGVENVMITDDSIFFMIPMWECQYSGRQTSENHITGGFKCAGEPFDTVVLNKNNEIAKYLIYPKPEMKNPACIYHYQAPDLRDDGIEVSAYQNENDSAFIHSIVSEIVKGEYGRIHSFLLYKNQKLVCEEYFYGYSPYDLHQIESCTKSLISLLVGIAKDKNLIQDLNEPICKVFPEYNHLKTPEYININIEHLLTMTSGFDPQNDMLFNSDDRVKFALNREIVHKPGTRFQYDGGNTEILGAIIKSKTGMYADEFAEKFLFNPLKINSYNWELLKQGGYPCMAGTLELAPRDMIKIGSIVLTNGKFRNTRIISEDWILQSTSKKTKTHIPGDNYGYQWWNLNLKSADNNYKAIWANGFGSQFIYIFPEINVVISTTGHNYEGDSWALINGIKKYLHLLDNQLNTKQ